MSKFLVAALMLSLLNHGAGAMNTVSAWVDQDFFRYCPPSRCSEDGPEIRFPLWLESSNTSSSCGAACTKLACSGQDTILVHPALGRCNVTAIDYRRAVIRCAPYGDEYSAILVGCPRELTPSGTSPAEDYNTAKDYNTPSGNANHFSYLVLNQLDMPLLPLDCEVASNGRVIPFIPSSDGSTFKLMAERIISFAETTASWDRGDIPYNCTQCEFQGRRCAFSPQRNQTFSEPRGPHGSRVKVIAGTASGFILLIVIIVFVVHKRRTRRHQEMEKEDEEFGKLPGIPRRFTFQLLQEATEQFRDKIGEGGFGSVFEGQFGEERIAVKRLDRAGQGKREFLAEVQTIGSIHHINLVRLIGFCAEKSHRLLVYEYMPKGSLDRWIYYRHDNNAPPLDWQTRRKIITHIAKGLSYLHEECMKRIAHLDVKPQNILLDDNFNAKLSDFGLCKLIDRDMSQVITRMRGTPGYLAPEWLTSRITEKADVYSFGIVVMEIISGRKNLDTSRSEESIHLIILLEEKVKSDRLVDLIDKHSNDMHVLHKQEVIQMMKLAMWCLQIDCKRRPQMSEVVKVLEGTMNVETNIDHNFIATSTANFGIAGNNVGSSAPPLASDVSGPR